MGAGEEIMATEAIEEQTRANRKVRTGVVTSDKMDKTITVAVINRKSLESILNYIETGKQEGRLVAGGGRAPGDGYFVEPTVIADVKPGARIEQEEIFGPVLAVVPARDFDHALELDPKNAEARHGRGLLREKLGDPGGGIEDLLRAAELEPGAATHWFNLGTVRRNNATVRRSRARVRSTLCCRARRRTSDA
jgi:hypothetical protein